MTSRYTGADWEMLPAVCQGIVGVERRGDDDRIAELLVRLNDADALYGRPGNVNCCGLDGSCRTPIAAGDIDGTVLRFRAASPPGKPNYWQPNGGPAPTLRPWTMPPTERGRAGPDFS